MTGKLYKFVNKYGLAMGENDEIYFVSLYEIITENQTIRSIIKTLHKAKPSKPITITFTPEKGSAGTYDYAKEIRIKKG